MILPPVIHLLYLIIQHNEAKENPNFELNLSFFAAIRKLGARKLLPLCGICKDRQDVLYMTKACFTGFSISHFTAYILSCLYFTGLLLLL